MLHKNS